MPTVSPRRSDAVPSIRVGCAGWSIASTQRALVGDGTSQLARYATRFDAVEINSTFYRAHRASTYQRWADSVPTAFRFSAKLPRTITHDARLYRVAPLLRSFLGEVGHLGDRLGCLLVQLPPSLAFDARTAATFFAMLRRRWHGGIACEPRHASWFGARVEALWQRHRIARVAADPALHATAAQPAGTAAPAYWRWHGAPRVYYSDYTDDTLRGLAERVVAATPPTGETWVIFDNTALGHAFDNAATLQTQLRALGAGAAG
ncbi:MULTISPECIES: DUF72 domain-containing protein [Gammaproteobacteria]|uniref:DUF72 domain-containing protein n=1 Tax=Gammaproteobacteria TaxID=1236 RepID=UPI000581D161|nr:DUF72 domain-containing protein [Xanthomonas sacchari]AJC46138.1 hypothetical protein SB85_10505 [Xanthomonas sacchari]MCW1776961.1 DUF72 domain-containing protein [Pantoea ananatis]